MEKTLNVLGIIIAWVMSVVLVVMLVVTPFVFSALSLLSSQTIAKAVTDVITAGLEAQPTAEKVEIVTLSNTTQSAAAENMGKDILAGMFGDSVSQEQLNAIMSSDAAKELIEAYVFDLTNAITGENKKASFTAEKIKSVVNDNMDEIVQVLRENVPECANMSVDELKSNIQKAVDEGAKEIMSALPDPEEIKEQLSENNPILSIATKILAVKYLIKFVFIDIIVVRALLIFACRIPGMRGFRWLAVDLFVGGGANTFITVGLLISKSAVGEIAVEYGAETAAFVGSLLSAFTNGMLIRTVVMLLAGGALLTAYIFIKKAKAKKMAAEAILEALPVEEAIVGEAQA